MFCKAVASFVLAIWFALLGIDFLGDTGFIHYRGSEVDKAVDSALTALGEVAKESNDTPFTRRPILALSPGGVFSPSIAHSFSTFFKKETNFLREDIPIYKLCLAFLI